MFSWFCFAFNNEVWVLTDKANCVTKQIPKEAIETRLPWTGLRKPEFALGWTRSHEGDPEETQKMEIVCEQACQERYFLRVFNS